MSLGPAYYLEDYYEYDPRWRRSGVCHLCDECVTTYGTTPGVHYIEDRVKIVRPCRRNIKCFRCRKNQQQWLIRHYRPANPQ